jgi:hypothetical protein
MFIFLQLDFRSQSDSVGEKKKTFTDMAHHLKAPVRIIANHESVISQIKAMVYPVGFFLALYWTVPVGVKLIRKECTFVSSFKEI